MWIIDNIYFLTNFKKKYVDPRFLEFEIGFFFQKIISHWILIISSWNWAIFILKSWSVWQKILIHFPLLVAWKMKSQNWVWMLRHRGVCGIGREAVEGEAAAARGRLDRNAIARFKIRYASKIIRNSEDNRRISIIFFLISGITEK